MIEIKDNFELKGYNTFGIAATAKHFVTANSVAELKRALESRPGIPKFILGGGSNMLLTRNIDALVVHVNLKGISIIEEDDDHVWIEAQAGENWHEFVLHTIDRGYGGLENMSLIPGNVGTTPIQNIGAYGTEIKDTFVACHAIELATMTTVTFTKDECEFGYRESIFKNWAKDKYVITAVQFKLTKRNHKINTAYGDITAELARQKVTTPTLKDVSNAVIAIRKSKLPDPKELGNSGSFFKNPIITIEDYKRASSNFPEMPHYPVSEAHVKVPAGWLIEKAGLKGKVFGHAGIHKNQALVLVNYGGATGSEILEVSRTVQKTVFDMFGIAIEAEVNII